jgi:peptidylprolyl isomerase
MSRRLLALTLTAALAIAAAGCGSSNDNTSSTPAADTGTTQAAQPATAKPRPKPKVKVPSGKPPKKLVVKDLIKGTGPTATTGKSVTVNYVGVLYKGGKEFDSSWKTGQPFAPFTLGQHAVIPGWDKGLVGMKVGGRRELIIPPSLAYGKAGSPPTIPPNSTLVFVVDLLGVS